MFYNGELLTETKEEGSFQSRHVLGYGVAASEVDGEAGYHAYHLDEQNSTVYITGCQRQVENAYAYDAFGNLRGQAGELLNRILYTGQQYDQEMGQYYLRARYYNPVVGRFTQEDEYRGDGLNLYAYCANNPVIYYDPSGYGELPDWLKVNFQRGNDFNKDYRVYYEYNEVRVTVNGNEYRVDSYAPSYYDDNGVYQQGAIVSRKYTQLSDVKKETAYKYLNEITQKYSGGTDIIDGNFNSAELRGGELSPDAQLVLQVPTQNNAIPEKVQKKADELGVKIEEVPDTVKEREEKEKNENCKEK